MTKRKLFEVFFDRMSAAEDAGMLFEAAWFAYAILEDRLVSMLQNSGGATKLNGKPVTMMGSKIDMLRKRACSDALLASSFPEHDAADKTKTELWKWKVDRDNLMHSMASGELTLEQIDVLVAKVARDGGRLARQYAAAAARLKKHRSKVLISAPPTPS